MIFADEIPLARKAEILNRVAQRVVELRLTPIAVVTLETIKPLTFLGSQLMVFFQPILTAFLPTRAYDEFAALLEERKNVEELTRRIEELEAERSSGATRPATSPDASGQDSVQR